MVRFEEAFEQLELPEFLNGHEHNGIKIMQSDDSANTIEIARRFQDLYDEICSARFALINACRENYPEYLSKDVNFKGHLWIRTQFLNNAIIWYNNSYDIFLNVLVFYYKTYDKTLTEIEVLEILGYEGQKYRNNIINAFDNEIVKNMFNEFKNSYIIETKSNKAKNPVRTWANTLKHRQMLRYEELRSNRIKVLRISKDTNIRDYFESKSKVNYDSSESIKHLSMEEVSKTLFNYHKDFITLMKFCLQIE